MKDEEQETARTTRPLADPGSARNSERPCPDGIKDLFVFFVVHLEDPDDVDLDIEAGGRKVVGRKVVARTDGELSEIEERPMAPGIAEGGGNADAAKLGDTCGGYMQGIGQAVVAERAVERDVGIPINERRRGVDPFIVPSRGRGRDDHRRLENVAPLGYRGGVGQRLGASPAFASSRNSLPWLATGAAGRSGWWGGNGEEGQRGRWIAKATGRSSPRGIDELELAGEADGQSDLYCDRPLGGVV